MSRVSVTLWTVAILLFSAGRELAAAPITLSGTIRDFCAPDIAATCTQLSDFEGAVTGVVSDMTSSTLTAGLPTAGANIDAGASSAANFAKWYVDSTGYNLAQPYALTLTEGPAGVYSYSSGSFFPIDGQLFGNQGRSNNFHFTLHLEGLLSFTDPNPGVPDFTFTFTGDDDLWIYVNSQRFIDLGGVHGAVGASFTEESLLAAGLLPSVQYDFDAFFAERHTSASNFSITTSLTLTPNPTTVVPEPGTWSLLLLGMAGLGATLRSRAKARRPRQ